MTPSTRVANQVAVNSSTLHARLRCLASRALPATLAALAACASTSDRDQTTNAVVMMGDSGPDSAAAQDAVAVGDRGPDSAAADSATSAVVGAEAGTCVDVEPSAAELTCATDQDCALVVTGPVCPGYELGALCETGVANSSGVARIAAQIAAIPHGNDAGFDFCDVAVGTPRCLQGMCTDCGLGNAPPGCLDAGAVTMGDGSPE